MNSRNQIPSSQDQPWQGEALIITDKQQQEVPGMNTQEIELRWVFEVVRRWWWLIFSMALLATVVAFAVTAWMPPVYEASAKLLISPARNSTASQYTDLMASEQLALTYSQMLKDRSVLAAVKEQLSLEQSVGKLGDQIQAELIRDTQLIQLTVSDSNADQAALIANTLAQVFKARVESLSAERYSGTIANAQDRVQNLQTQVNTLEGQVKDLRSQKVGKDLLLGNKQVVLNGLRQDYQTIQSNKQQTEQAIAETTGKVLVFESVQVEKDYAHGTYVASTVVSAGQVQDIGGTTSPTNDNAALTYGNLLIKAPMLQKIISDLNLTETPEQLARKITIETVSGTRLIRIWVSDTNATKAEQINTALVSAFITQTKALLTEPYTNRLAGIQLQFDNTSQSVEGLQNEIGVLTAEIAQLESEVDRQETILSESRTDLRESQKNLEGVLITAMESSDTVVVSEPAVPPVDPSGSHFLYVALAGMVGIFLGVGTSFLLEFIDNRIRTDQDVRKQFGLPAFGSIGRFNNEAGELVMVSDPNSASADDFRILSTHIRRLYENQGVRSILISSPTPMEGKTVVVSNLAFALARMGMRVVAVDADLRLPRLHKVFGLNQAFGLANTIKEESVNGSLQNTELAELKIMTSGGIPNNPAELLASPFTEKLVHDLLKTVDIVLIDCPPVLSSVDASILAQVVDGVLLVLKVGQSENLVTQKTLEALRRVNARVIGALLNAAPEQKEPYYQYYRRAADKR